MGNVPGAHRPSTTFRTGDDATELVVNYPVTVLLFAEGFWGYCRDHVPVSNPTIFNGPYEGGQIAPEELEEFISAVRRWADHYEGLEDTVYSTRPSPTGQPTKEVEVMGEELAQVRRQVEQMALQCQSEGIPLGFST